MEGEEILQVLKANKCWGTVYVDIENYLSPFVKYTLPSLTNKKLQDYEKFSYKLLKLCVSELKKELSRDAVETVLKVSSLCVGSLERCHDKPNKNLNFEKLLLHLADGCRQSGHVQECVKTCRILQEKLSHEVAPEALLLQHVFQVLWQTSPLRQLPFYNNMSAVVCPPVLDLFSSLVSLNIPVITDTNIQHNIARPGESPETVSGKGLLWLSDVTYSLSQEFGRQREFTYSCQVQEFVCAATLRYCLLDNRVDAVRHRAETVPLLARLHYLARVTRKLHNGSAAIHVLQRTLNLLPEELLGSEYTGVLHEELARTHLQLALQSSWRHEEESKYKEKVEQTEVPTTLEAEFQQGVEHIEGAGPKGEAGQNEVRRDIQQHQADPVTSDMCLCAEDELLMLECETYVHQTLAQCVRYWEGVGSAVEKSSYTVSLFYKSAAMLEDIYLTAILTAVHCLPVLVLRVCQVLLRLLEVAGEVLTDTDRMSLQNKVFALREEVSGAGRQGDVRGGVASEVGVASNRDVSVAELSRRLSQARLLLYHNQSSDSRAVLLRLVDSFTSANCDCPKGHHYHRHGYCPQSMLLAASARQLSAELLLHSAAMATDALPPSESDVTFVPTPVELSHVAMRNVWRIFDDTGGHLTSATSHTMWVGLLSLLRLFKWTCRLYLVQGCHDKAFGYIREGAMLARKLKLTPWYCEFLLLLGEIYMMRGNSTSSLHLTRQLSRLLHCSDFIDYLAPPTDTPTPKTAPTAQSLLAHAPHGVCDSSLLLRQRLQTVLLTCRVRLMEDEGDTSHVTSHVTSNPPSHVTSNEPSHVTSNTPSHVTSDGHVTSLLTALEVADDAVTERDKNKTTRSKPQSTGMAKGRGRGRGRGSGSNKVKKKSVAVERVSEVDLVRADVACLRAECHLLLWQPDQAIVLLDECMARVEGVAPHVGGVASCEDQLHHSLVRARLHFLKGKSLALKINGRQSRLADQEVWLRSCPEVRQCWAEFRQCYELCFPVRPVILLREACLWLALLSEASEDVHHYLTTSQQISFNHITALALSAKIQSLLKEGGQSNSWKQLESHVSDIRSALGSSPGAILVDTPLLKARATPFLKARAIVACPCPQPASDVLSRLPATWMTLTCTLSPKPHPSCSSRLLVVKTTPPEAIKRPTSRARGGRRPRTSSIKPSTVISSFQLGGEGQGVESLVWGLQRVLEESNEGLGITDKKTWWSKRRKLDQQMEALLVALGDMAPGDLANFSGPVLLVLGRGLHHVPWEVLPFLGGVAVARTPSLTFAAAHNAMVGVSGEWSIDTSSAYFVLNPQGDLKKTEEMFSGRFSMCEGWEGVAGTPPTSQQLRQALENKSLYIYCGHNSGCGLLSDPLRTLARCAVSLLMGCRSAQLKQNGLCDPTGHAHSYLLAGCPAIVGCLWTVTDGDLDRFCDGLITLLLSADSAHLPSHVTRSRLKCQLRWLVGASPVVYGLPVVKPRQPAASRRKKT